MSHGIRQNLNCIQASNAFDIIFIFFTGFAAEYVAPNPHIPSFKTVAVILLSFIDCLLPACVLWGFRGLSPTFNETTGADGCGPNFLLIWFTSLQVPAKKLLHYLIWWVSFQNTGPCLSLPFKFHFPDEEEKKTAHFSYLLLFLLL